MLPDKASLLNSTKSSVPMSVTFQVEDIQESSEGVSSKRVITRKQSIEPVPIHEIRAWSSFIGVPTNEQVLTDTDKRSKDSNGSKSSCNQCLQQVVVDQPVPISEERSNRYRSALIDQNKQHYHRHDKPTWRSFIGTMSDINHILMDKRTRHPWPCFPILMIFIDSCFRGIGQVMFANNPLSGLVSLQ